MGRLVIYLGLPRRIPQPPIPPIPLALQLIPQRQDCQIRPAQHLQVTRPPRKVLYDLDALRFWGADRDKREQRGLDAGAGGGVANLGDDGGDGVELLCAGAEDVGGGVVLDEGACVEDEAVDWLEGCCWCWW